MNEHIAELDRYIHELDKRGAWHKRRGFRLSDATTQIATNHLLEEAVELQAEMANGNFASQIKEAGNLLGVFLHLLWMAGIPLERVISSTFKTLDENFTFDESEIVTNQRGFTRATRADSTPQPTTPG